MMFFSKSLLEMFSCCCCQDDLNSAQLVIETETFNGRSKSLDKSLKQAVGQKDWCPTAPASKRCSWRPRTSVGDAFYTGQWAGDTWHGTGKMERKDGSTFEGRWE